MFLETYNGFRSELFLKEEKERKNIKFVGIVSGICIIAYIILQNIASIPFMFEPLYSIYHDSPAMQCTASILFSVFCMLPPFAVGARLIRKRTKLVTADFSAPVSIPLMLSATALGFFVCLVGNYLSGLYLTLTEAVGFELTSPEFEVPSGFFGRLIYLVSVAVVPPLVEEFAVRGAVMQPLRRYGDRFAIVSSALIFAILHGNLVQAPFAFIAGLGIGYAVCITNSLWTGILIHFCNNLYSVITAFMIEDITDENLLNSIYFIVLIAAYIVSILGCVIFVMLKEKRKLTPSFTVSGSVQKASSLFINIPMVIAILIMLHITSEYVSFKGIG
ncbi:MAG: CPBP family intramembrane metalloprotease [Clostridia bacterium]|nr:CPBP family intramembrane metalloprotease [Clostridia bacterium]